MKEFRTMLEILPLERNDLQKLELGNFYMNSNLMKNVTKFK